ncbi:hypothetical protein [Nocardioides furvisabuli]|nr:hypothetical protein [Nocardioides furvisabuli]
MAGSARRKPWYFRWWAITAAVLVALSIFGNLLPDDTQAEPTSAADDPSSEDEPSSDPTRSAEEIEAERREQARQEREEKRAEAQKRREERAAAEKAQKAAAAEKAKRAAAEAARVNPATYRAVTDRDLALIVKNPDAHVGKKIMLYGYVTQSDSVTGPKNLLADTSATPGYEWYDFDTNSLISAPGPNLFANVVEDDLVTLYVEVVGSYSYDTQAGGNTTVPQFLANIVRVTGSVA